MEAGEAYDPAPIDQWVLNGELVARHGGATGFRHDRKFAKDRHHAFVAAISDSAIPDAATVVKPAKTAMGVAGMSMSRTGPITRFRTLDGGQRAQLARATIAMSLSSAAVACLPFRRAIRFGAVPVSSVSPQRVEGWRWAVEAVSRRLPWRTMCIEKGLALQRLLRRSGVDARLHYGARHHPIHGELQAHVWITVDDRAIIGGDEAAGFAEVACYP